MRHHRLKVSGILLTVLLSVMLGNGQGSFYLRLPAVIADGMVLQQTDSVWLWGWGLPGNDVRIRPGWQDATYSAKVNNHAQWQCKISTGPAGGPFTIGLRSGPDTLTLRDVWLGEVWICSGQSNMEWSWLNGARDMAAELQRSPNPSIRLFHIPRTGASSPQNDVRAGWEMADSQSLRRFSAVGYFFGRMLHDSLRVPVGLIHASWGGTPAEAWMPPGLVEADSVLHRAAGKLNRTAWWPHEPSVSWNGMLAPLTRYGVRGVIWYQGETNTGTHTSYRHLFTTMMEAWRAAWQRPLPFYYVQIAPYRYGTPMVGALLREQQTLASTHPGTGMVVISDVVDSVTDIHPSRKRPVGERLAAQALTKTYGIRMGEVDHPRPKEWIVRGGRMVIRFEHTGGGLQAKGGPLTGFAIAGTDRQWRSAKARIVGNEVEVWHEEIAQPLAVRYMFDNTTIGNLFGAGGLPAILFRTDAWPAD